MRSIIILLLGAIGLRTSNALALEQSHHSTGPDCRIQAVEYKGWHAQEISNEWTRLIIVPQNGGRLMQASFAGHPYLFVNPAYVGKYLPPTPGRWFNYGGDKLWLLPEGNNDEQHWVGDSDNLDDGPFSFQILSQGKNCEAQLTGPADPQTGIQFVRTIGLDTDSPRIRFHASMRNVSGHPIEWSMQSVSQYETADLSVPSGRSQDVWTFTPANPESHYLNRYHVRFGPAENPAASVRDDGLFALHYVHLAAELWLDSTAGWLAVVDNSSQYAMVERFRYEQDKPYPGKASVIFWTNGAEVKVNAEGHAALSGGDDEEQSPYYLEAEINSPLCRLDPGEACTLDTEWFPARTGSEFHGVTNAGIVTQPLRAVRLSNGNIRLSGSFGIFFPGHLVAHFYNQHGSAVGRLPLSAARPDKLVVVDTEIAPQGAASRVSLHLEDETGLDRGALQEIQIGTAENH